MLVDLNTYKICVYLYESEGSQLDMSIGAAEKSLEHQNGGTNKKNGDVGWLVWYTMFRL